MMHAAATFPGTVSRRPHATLPLLGIALLGALSLGGCARGGTGLSWQAGRGTTPAAPAVAQTPSDPLLAFASRAQPGAQDNIVLGDGQPATVRLARVYAAASGRECREVVVGAGMAERSRLVCVDPSGNWAEARPLLRGGGVARP